MIRPTKNSAARSGWIWAGLWLLLGCQVAEPAKPAPPAWVATVDGELITLDEFEQALERVKQSGKGFFADAESAEQIKRELLEQMIDDQLLRQEAARRRIVVDPQLVQASLESLEQEYPGGLQAELHRQGRDREAFRRETHDSLLRQRLMKQEVLDRIAVSRQEIEQYYQQHRDAFVRPEEVRVRQIVSRTEEEAEELRRQLARGASFEELARQYSLGPEAAQGGDLGYFPPGRMPPAIDEVVFKLWPGRPSKVIPSPYGYHLFLLVDKRPARELTLDEARPDIERELVDTRSAEAERYFIRTLRERARVERDLVLVERAH